MAASKSAGAESPIPACDDASSSSTTTTTTTTNDDGGGKLSAGSSGRIFGASEARAVLAEASLLVGFHPDQATEACVDFAVRRGVSFAVCPCCVFPSLFPDRVMPTNNNTDHQQQQPGWERRGKKEKKKNQRAAVSTYDDFIVYLRAKHPAIQVAELPFRSKTGTARKTVLYAHGADLR